MGKIIGKIFAPTAPAQTPMLRCEICGKAYKTEKGLAEHMAKEHPLDILPEKPDEA